MPEKLPEPVKTKAGKTRVRLYGISHSTFERGLTAIAKGRMWPQTKKLLEREPIVCHEKLFDKAVIAIPKETKPINIDMKKRTEWSGQLRDSIERLDKQMTVIKQLSREHEKTIKDVIQTLDNFNPKQKKELLENKEKMFGLKKKLKLSDRDINFLIDVYPFIPKTLKGERITQKEIDKAVEYRRFTEDQLTLMNAQIQPSEEKMLPLIEKFAHPSSTEMNLRDAYMAEKIHHVADNYGEVPVFVGGAHVEGIKHFLAHPKERKKLIEFFKKEAPVSYKELKEFKKQHKAYKRSR